MRRRRKVELVLVVVVVVAGVAWLVGGVGAGSVVE